MSRASSTSCAKCLPMPPTPYGAAQARTSSPSAPVVRVSLSVMEESRIAPWGTAVNSATHQSAASRTRSGASHRSAGVLDRAAWQRRRLSICGRFGLFGGFPTWVVSPGAWQLPCSSGSAASIRCADAAQPDDGRRFLPADRLEKRRERPRDLVRRHRPNERHRARSGAPLRTGVPRRKGRSPSFSRFGSPSCCRSRSSLAARFCAVESPAKCPWASRDRA